MKYGLILLYGFCLCNVFAMPLEYNKEDIIYYIASQATNVPVFLLKAIAVVESNEFQYAIGDGGKSKGMMQINEIWRDYYIKKYGTYDPMNKIEAVILSGNILYDHFTFFKRWEYAIAAYRQGRRHVIENGIVGSYAHRILYKWKFFDRTILIQ